MDRAYDRALARFLLESCRLAEVRCVSFRELVDWLEAQPAAPTPVPLRALPALPPLSRASTAKIDRLHVAGRLRTLAIPELFLGLLAVAVAVVLTAKIFADTIHDARHIRDTISITGSARKPITSDLVRWSVSVSTEARRAAPAARRLRGQAARVRSYLVQAGIPAGAITPSVVRSDEQVEELPHHRRKISYRVSQDLDVSTRKIDVVEGASTGVGRLLERGIGVSAGSLQYVSTELTKAKLDALAAATEDARRRAEILVKGLGGKLGSMRSTSLGVYQITPRDSTDVSDYGINDTSSRDKDVNAVVTATFAVRR
jgi:uncharacterized protein